MSARSMCGWLRWLVITAVVLAAGCSGRGSVPPEGQLQIEAVAHWYHSYRAAHDEKAPPNDKAFRDFIEQQLKETGQTVDVDQLLTSPRDGQKYVVNYKPNSSSLHQNVAVYEREGYNGKKWLAFENKWSEEVDDAKLKEYLARK